MTREEFDRLNQEAGLAYRKEVEAGENRDKAYAKYQKVVREAWAARGKASVEDIDG